MVPAMTERFEMRFDTATLERVDVWRAEQGDVPSRSEAVRRLVDAGLSTSSNKKFRMTNPEKLITWLLTELLTIQPKYENKDSIRLIQQAIYGGHFWALEWDMQGVIHNHVDREEAVRFVVDVMDMWSFIENAVTKWDAADLKHFETASGYIGTPSFLGFDGNNEGEYMGIANFLVREMGRFASFKDRSLNSHSPTVARYGQMARRFEPVRLGLTGRGLSVEEIIALMKRD